MNRIRRRPQKVRSDTQVFLPLASLERKHVGTLQNSLGAQRERFWYKGPHVTLKRGNGTIR